MSRLTYSSFPCGPIRAVGQHPRCILSSVSTPLSLPMRGAHLEVAGDEALSKPDSIALATDNRDIEPLKVLLELLPDGHGP